MKILGLDSSGLVAGAAVVEDDVLVAEYTVNYKKTHSQTLLPMATAKGMGLALEKPLVEVPTLEGLAYNLWGTDNLICPLMDARRNQVYTGLYEFVRTAEGLSLKTVAVQQTADIGEILEQINLLGRQVIFLGDGVRVYEENIWGRTRVPWIFAPPSCNRQRASSIAALGALYYAQGKTVPAAAHRPEYLRKSQAEREAEAKKRAE